MLSCLTSCKPQTVLKFLSIKLQLTLKTHNKYSCNSLYFNSRHCQDPRTTLKSRPAPPQQHSPNLPQTPGLPLPLQQTQTVALSDGSLDIPDDGTSGSRSGIGIHEFDANLSDVTGVARASEDSVDFGEFDWLILLRCERGHGLQ